MKILCLFSKHKLIINGFIPRCLQGYHSVNKQKWNDDPNEDLNLARDFMESLPPKCALPFSHRITFIGEICFTLSRGYYMGGICPPNKLYVDGCYPSISHISTICSQSKIGILAFSTAFFNRCVPLLLPLGADS